jgi:hypothetical protein
MNPDMNSFDEKQLDILRRHLALVFKHEIDPSYGDKEHQSQLQDIHDGRPPVSSNLSPHGLGLLYKC